MEKIGAGFVLVRDGAKFLNHGDSETLRKIKEKSVDRELRSVCADYQPVEFLFGLCDEYIFEPQRS